MSGHKQDSPPLVKSLVKVFDSFDRNRQSIEQPVGIAQANRLRRAAAIVPKHATGDSPDFFLTEILAVELAQMVDGTLAFAPGQTVRNQAKEFADAEGETQWKDRQTENQSPQDICNTGSPDVFPAQDRSALKAILACV